MKQILFFILFSLSFSKITYSQNWNTFTKDTSYYSVPAYSYNFGAYFFGNYIRCVFIDSVSNSGGDSTFYFYKTIGIEPNNFNVKKTFGRKCWMGKQITKKINHDEEYINVFNETLLFKPISSLNDSWTICQDSTGILFNAKITNMYDTTINGVLDSIKEITISTDSNAININHYYNNYKFLFSKHNGWIKICQLNIFPYYTINGNNTLAKCIPSIHKKINKDIVHKNLNYRDTMVIRPGCAFETSFYEMDLGGNITTNTFYDSITTSSQLTNFIDTNRNYRIDNYLPEYYIIDSLTQQVSPQIIDLYLDYYCENIPMFTIFPLDCALIGFNSNDSSYEASWSVSACFHTQHTVVSNVGVFLDEFYDDGLGIKSQLTTSVTYINDTFCVSTFIPNNINELSTINAKVYPNPTSGKLNIELNESNATFSLSDINGRILIEKNILQKDEINFSHLPTGFYIGKIKTKNGNKVVKVLKE